MRARSLRAGGAMLLISTSVACLGAKGSALDPSRRGDARRSEAATAQASASVAQPGYPRGSDSARVTVVEFTDFGCHYCAEFALETMPGIDAEFVATGAVKWRLIPIATASTPHARAAAAAAVCADEQEALWAMHDWLFGHRAEWVHVRDPETRFREGARAVGMDAIRFTQCTRRKSTRDVVDGLYAFARQSGVRGAPTFFIAGRRIEGALPLALMREVMRTAIAMR